jgi:hypothetical protein
MVTGAPKKIRGAFLPFVTFGVILLVPGRMYPQVTGGTLSGTVTDQSGAVIRGDGYGSWIRHQGAHGHHADGGVPLPSYR